MLSTIKLKIFLTNLKLTYMLRIKLFIKNKTTLMKKSKLIREETKSKSEIVKKEIKPKEKKDKPKVMTYPEALQFVAGIGRKELNYLTEKHIEELEEIAGFLTLQQIADYFGLAINGLKNIFDRQPAARDAYKVGKANKIKKFANLLQEKALGINKNIDTSCVVFFLKTRGGWSEGAPVETIDVESNETPEEKAAKEQEYKEFLEFKKLKGAGKLKEFMTWAKLKFIGN